MFGKQHPVSTAVAVATAVSLVTAGGAAAAAAATTAVTVTPASTSWDPMAYDSAAYLEPTRQSDTADATAPAGDGAHFFGMDGAADDEVQLYRGTVLDGQQLSTVSTLQYATFVEEVASGLNQPAYLRLTLDTNGDQAPDSSLFFQPAYQSDAQGPVVNGSWQAWNATDPDAVWSTDGSYAGADVRTWDQVQTEFGSSDVLASQDPTVPAGSGVGGLALIVGDGSGGLQAEGSYGVDQVVVNDTTYDFEPAPPGGGGGGGTTEPIPPPAPEGATDAEGGSSSDPDGTSTASSEDTTVTAEGAGAFTVSQYPDNPEAAAPLAGDTGFFDVLTSDDSEFSALTVTQCGLTDDAHSIVWFDGTRWVKASSVTYADGCATITITDSTSPSLADLTGTVFGAGELPVTRLAGEDRIGTAVAVSQDRFPGDDSAEAVVLARSNAYPDALAGAPLADAENAPILLTKPGSLAAQTLDEIDRVVGEGGTVFVLGGEGAVSADVVAALTEAGYAAERIAGDNRYQTAVAIAEALPAPDAVIEVPGTDFADAVSAGPVASTLDAAILLTKGTAQSRATGDYLDTHPDLTRYAVGGLSAQADPDAEAVFGENRYETSTEVATRFFEAPTRVNLATGLAFPDALTAGPMVGVPTVLVPGTGADLPTVTRSYLDGADDSVLRLTVLGGDGAVSPSLAEHAGLRLQ